MEMLKILAEDGKLVGLVEKVCTVRCYRIDHINVILFCDGYSIYVVDFCLACSAEFYWFLINKSFKELIASYLDGGVTCIGYYLQFLCTSTGCSKKNGYPVLFCDNFGNSAPILTILSLLQAEIYGA